VYQGFTDFALYDTLRVLYGRYINRQKNKGQKLNKKNELKGWNNLVEITREEAEIIRLELGDDIVIATTCRQKPGNRKKRYMEENRTSMRLLRQIRRGDYGRRNDSDRKKK